MAEEGGDLLWGEYTAVIGELCGKFASCFTGASQNFLNFQRISKYFVVIEGMPCFIRHSLVRLSLTRDLIFRFGKLEFETSELFGNSNETWNVALSRKRR